MAERSAQLPSTTNRRAWLNRLVALGQTMPRSGIVPDSIHQVERAIRLHQRAGSTVKTRSVDYPPLDNSGTIHETRGGVEPGIE